MSNVDIKISAIATNPECARVSKRKGANEIYVPALNFKRGTASQKGVCTEKTQTGYPKQITIMFPTVLHDMNVTSLENKHNFDIDDIARNSKKIFADSIGAVEYAIKNKFAFDIGPHIPVLNSISAKYFAELGAQSIWLSPELSLSQIRDITSSFNDVEYGLTVIGTQELMITEHCELMSEDGGECGKQTCNQNCQACARRQRPHFLLDRKGYEFPVVTDILGRSHIYNSVQTDVVHALPQLVEAGVTQFMVDTTLMDKEQTAQAMGRLAFAVNNYLANPNNPKVVDKPSNTTTGHLFREVL